MKVDVAVPGHEHAVHVGRGVRRRVGPLAAQHTNALRALVVTQEPVARHWLDDVASSLDAAGLDTHTVVVPDGEANKDVATLASAWDACAQANLSRRDLLVTLGGGVVTDLGGFAAATFNRGIRVLHVPSTLLGQVDAAIGGKTGIDLPTGKNLVGAIHQPVAVVADTELLTTLPGRVLREGFGEVVKHALLADRGMFEELVAGGADWLDPSRDRGGLVARHVALKAAVVADDEREHGRRAHLNLGHTYGHVLEVLVGLGRWWHGEAVAVGLLVALALGEVRGLHGPGLRRRTAALLASLGLPTAAPVLPRGDLMDVMRRDKKADGRLRFVVLEDLGAPTIVTPSFEEIDRAIAMVERRDLTWPPRRGDPTGASGTTGADPRSGTDDAIDTEAGA